jgi:hypothetical protein
MELANLLGVPAHLVGSGDVSLQIAFQKYSAYLIACQNLDRMVADRTWVGKKPSKTDIVELFVSKSFFHSHYTQSFPKVTKYPKMVAWLEGKGDQADIDLWGVEKPVYIFKDLDFWLANGGTLEVKTEEEEMSQGKKKGKKGKGKEKEKEETKTKMNKKKKGKKDSTKDSRRSK